MARLAYIASRYPEVSHTFILREVRALRAAGFDIHTFAVRRAKPESVLSAADREEFERTMSLLPARFWKLCTVHAGLLAGAPRGYLKAFKTALTVRTPGLRALLWNLFYFAEAGLLAAELRRRDVRHVHAHFANVAASVARLAAEMIGGTWSITLHGLADFGNPLITQLREKIASARMVVCVSRYGMAQAMLNSAPEYWDKLVRIPCGIDARDAAGKQQTAQRNPAENGLFRLLCVGRLSPEKGHRILLAALRDVLSLHPNVRLTLVGDGPQRNELQNLAGRLGVQEYVTFTGAVGQDDIGAYYQQADAFVLPSFAEGLPVVLMEALAYGVPVIASGIMGIPELVTSGENGLLVPPADASALARAIGALAADPTLCARLGEAGRQRVLREYDVHQSADQLACAFEDLLEARPARANRERECPPRMSAIAAHPSTEPVRP